MMRMIGLLAAVSMAMSACGPSPAQRELMDIQADIADAQKELARGVAGSLSAQDAAIYDPENPGEPPSLEAVTYTDLTNKTDDQQSREHTVGFGYWIARCKAVKKGREATIGWCDVRPSLTAHKANTRLMSYEPNRANVSFYSGRAVQIALKTKERAENSRLEYDCGFAKWHGAHPGHQLKFFYEREAKKFVNSMKKNDCTVQFTPKNAEDVVTIHLPAHGFREALKFAERFMKQPEV